MHPALSIILFSTLSGAGLGLGAIIGLFGIPDGTPLLPAFPLVPAAAVAIALASAGLVCSVFHLRRPLRAWRALSQWRSSWLSREGILAMAALAAVAAQALINSVYPAAGTAVGLVAFLFCLLAVFATSMIYAQLRAVPAWNTPLTPILYIAFAAAGGCLAAAAMIAGFAGIATITVLHGATADMTAFNAFSMAAVVTVFAAWALHALWWFRLDRTGTGRSTPESATRLGQFGAVRLLEPPHTGSNYLLDEMGHVIARRHAAKLRLVGMLTGGLVPIALLVLIQLLELRPLPACGVAGLAFLLHLAGAGISRWLFFAEARHTVTLYYS